MRRREGTGRGSMRFSRVFFGPLNRSALGDRRAVIRVASAWSSAQRAAAGTYLPPTAPGDGIHGFTMRWAITPTPNVVAPPEAAAARAESSAKQDNGGGVSSHQVPRLRRLISQIRRLRR